MRLINLIPLHEIDFRNQAAFDAYNKQHKLRPDTKVNIAGKNTTAGQAVQSSTTVKGTSVFGGKAPSTKKGSNDDVDVSDYKTDGEGKVLYKGKKVADYRYNINTDELTLNTKDGIEVFDTHKDMYKYLQKKKEEEPKKQGFLSKMANMFTNKDGGGDKKSDTSLSSMIPTGDATKDDFYNAGETLRQMGWKPDDIAKRIGDNLPYMDDEKDIPMMKNSDDKEDWINLYKKSIAMKKAGYSSSEIADKLRANL